MFLVERNMKLRRKRLHAGLQMNEIAPSTGNFPMMGVPGYRHTGNTPEHFTLISDQSTLSSHPLIPPSSPPHPTLSTKIYHNTPFNTF